MKDFKQEIINHLEDWFDSKVNLTKHVKEEDGKLGFDIVIFRANLERPYHILSTVGLSKYKMAGKSKFAEFIVYLDKSWDLFSDKEQYTWLYKMLQDVATAFYKSKRKLEFGQVYLTEGANTFSPYTEMNSAVLYYPVGMSRGGWVLKLGFNKKLNFYLITTGTYREYALIRKKGGLSFVNDYLLEDDDLENLAIYNKREK